MRHFLIALLLPTLLSAGCGKHESATFSSAAPTSAKGTEKAADIGKIEFVASPITVQKGKTSTITINVTRKDSRLETMYKGEIKLEFDTSDAKGLTIEPATIPAGADKIEVTVKAAPDATGGMVTIIGKGAGVEPFENRVRADVR